MNYPQEEIEALVRQVVKRTLGEGREQRRGQRQILDAETVRHLPQGSTHPIAAGTLVTPLARQVAMEQRIQLVVAGELSATDQTLPTGGHLPAAAGKQVVALGTDHGGYDLKEQIKRMLQSMDSPYQVIDCGTHGTDSVDYPDFAYAVARLVANGQAWRGIIIDGAGIGSCMAANKVPGVRAAMCYDQATAVNSREHNNANVLTLGAGLIGPNLAKQIVNTWLETEFGGGRHARRVDKIDQIGKRFAKQL
jgi:ribose 5-phosphate isomerase B